MQHEVILGLSNGGTKKPIKLGISVGNQASTQAFFNGTLLLTLYL